MVMSPAGTKNDCAGKDQEQFYPTRPMLQGM
jgi:hypothetical protein